MNTYESNKMNSFANTEEVMKRNETIWKTDEDVSKAFAAIQVKLPLVYKYHQNQKKNGNTATVLKKGTKGELIKMGVKISKSAVSYAVSKNNLALEMSVKLTKSELNNLTQIALYDTLTLFYNTVLPFQGSLKHLNPDDLETFNQLLQSFKTAMPQTGANTDETKTATQNIGEAVKELNALFNTLDKHIAPYEYTFPDFFSDYDNSRGVRTAKKKEKKSSTKEATKE